MSKTILTDVDGTLVDFMGPFIRFMSAQGFAYQQKPGYSLGPCFGLTVGRVNAMIEQFFHDGHATTLPALPGAAVAMPALRNQGFRFVAISACPRSTRAIASRKKNLEDTFGFQFDAVHCLGLGASKREVLQRYRPSVWVEDHAGHANDGAALGHTAFLLNQPHNEREPVRPGVTRVDSWFGIAQCVIYGVAA